MSDDFFALPPFDADAALLQIRRTLRDLHPLSERGAGFELRGKSVAELEVDGATIQARLARRPARSPEWDRFVLKTSPDVRRFTEEVKRRMGRWSADDDR